MNNIRNCPICSNDKVTFLFHQDFHNNTISLMNDYYVVSCNRCGMVYAYNIPSQEEFTNYYYEMSKYEYQNTDGKISDKFQKHFRNIFDFIKPFINKDFKILDIGCATGGLLNIFKQKGYKNVFGIEPAEQCKDIAKKLYDIDIYHTVENFIDKDEKFDLIILSSVLEHIVDIDKTMQMAKNILKKDGLLFISVPNIMEFYKQETNHFQQFSVEHINYFSIETLTILMRNIWKFDLAFFESNQNELSKTTNYDIFSLYRNTDNYLETDKIFSFNKDGIDFIQKYIQKNLKEEYIITKKLEEKLKDMDNYIVWGVGTSTLRLLGNGLDINKVTFFVDSNSKYQYKEIQGKYINPPTILINERSPIIIPSYAYQDEIKQQIKDLKLGNKIITLYD